MESTAPTPRKSGRPLSFDRGAALEQAMLTFWRHGYETTSISDLTAAMGVTAPSIYTAFGNKRGLFLEAMRRYAGAPEDFQHSLDRAATAREAARDMLVSSAVAFTGDATPRGCLLASATASGSAACSDVQANVATIRRDIIDRLAARIERDITSGLLPAATAARTLAAIMIAQIQGMSVLARDGMARGDLMAIADGAMAIWPEPQKAP